MANNINVLSKTDHELENDYFSIHNNFFIYTDSKRILNKLVNFDSTNLTKNYWMSVIELIKLFEKGNVEIITEVKLNEDEVAYYIDSKYQIIDNFLPFDNARINSLIKLNMAPYYAYAIGIFKIENGNISEQPYAYLMINAFKKKFATRLYRVGLMSDIHYNDTDISDHTNVLSHYNGDGEYITDITKAFKWYEDKENVDFVCASGDVTTDNIAHLINFRTMIKQTMVTTPFYTCFGNHDYRSTANYNVIDTVYDEYENEEIHLTEKTRLQVWNSILTPSKPKFTIHYQDPTTEYGKTSYWFEVPTVNGKSDIYAFLSVNYLKEDDRKYRIDNSEPELVWHKMYAENIKIDTTKNAFNDSQEICEYTPEYNLVLKYSDYPQRFGFDYHGIENYTHNVRINKCKILDANGQDVTDLITSQDNPYIGVFGNDETYHISGTFDARTFGDENGTYRIEMPISSAFHNVYPDVELPIKVFLDIEIAAETTKTNRTTIANYKLTKDSPYIQDIIKYVGFMPKSYNLKFYDNAALLWLKDLLETYPDKRIFIFTHQFFPQKAGNNNGRGYAYSMDSWRITKDSAYCLCGIQFEFLNKLNNEFKNTIWFTGHSHYDFDTQITDNTVTICNKDFAIYRPDDIDFGEENRYHRRNFTINNKVNVNVYEYYRKHDTTEHVGMKMLYNRISLPNGTYSFKVFASNAYTPDRGFDQVLDDGNGTVELHLITTDGSIKDNRQINYVNNTSLHEYSMYDFIIDFVNVKVKNGFIEFNITKTHTGTNWFTASILQILDENGNDITNTLDANEWKTKDDKLASTVLDYYLPNELIEEYKEHYDIHDIYMNKQSTVIVTNNNTGYNVHIPSTSRPLVSNYGNEHKLSIEEDYGSSVRPYDSAGMIMDIYEDYVDIRGISFKINELYPNKYINKYHPLGQYRILIPSK